MLWEKVIFWVMACITLCFLLLSKKLIALRGRLAATGRRLQNSNASAATTELHVTIQLYRTSWDAFRALMLLAMVAAGTMSWMATRLSVGWVMVHALVCVFCVNEGLWFIRAKGGSWYYGYTIWLALNGAIVFATLGDPHILLP